MELDDPFDMNMEEVVEKFDTPKEYCDFLAEKQVTEIEETEVTVTEDMKNKISALLLDAFNEDHFWDLKSE